MISADVTTSFRTGEILAKIAEADLEGLRLGGEHVLKLARDHVPIETGTLERSGMVTDDGKDTVAVSFDTPYAVRQHEDTTLRHDAGRSSKYLERAVADGAQDVLRLLAARAEGAIGGAAR